MKTALVVLLAVCSSSALASPAVEKAKQACPDTGAAVTAPAPVDTAAILEAMAHLKTAEGKAALDLSQSLVEEVHHTFDPARTKTKMEQFYRLLFIISREISPALGNTLTLDPVSTRAILLAAKVFTDPAIPSQIVGVRTERERPESPRYTVDFSEETTVLPLNRGEGFYLFKDGKCQHAQKLIFKKTFSVTIQKNKRGNIETKDFKGVDLFGDFGNRGMFDIDLQYVTIREVEFFHGTTDGKVTAYVSREEFKKNKHSPILKIITRFVGDTSVQPIDW